MEVEGASPEDYRCSAVTKNSSLPFRAVSGLLKPGKASLSI